MRENAAMVTKALHLYALQSALHHCLGEWGRGWAHRPNTEHKQCLSSGQLVPAVPTKYIHTTSH